MYPPTTITVNIMSKFKPVYYATREQAQAVIDTLPAFTAGRFNDGPAIYKIVEFRKGYAIQLGDFGNYHPRTHADLAQEFCNSALDCTIHESEQA